MKVTGFVIHQSACASINGKGYDFFVTKEGVIIPAAEPTEPSGPLHICIEGDFANDDGLGDPQVHEQLFAAAKLIAGCAEALGVDGAALSPHREGCPGARFPWAKLVLSRPDRYH